MSDLDRLLRDSLKRAGDRYDPAASTASRERFVAFRKRRAMTRGFASVAIVAVVIGAAAVAAPWPQSDDVGGPAGPAGPASAPAGEMYVTQTIQVGDEPTDIEIDGDKLYIGHEGVGPIEILDPSQQEVTDSLGGFINAQDAEVPPFKFVEAEPKAVWTAGGGRVAILGFEDGRIPCWDLGNDEDMAEALLPDKGADKGCPSYYQQSAARGLATDLELTSDSIWVAGPDPAQADRYEIARYFREGFIRRFPDDRLEFSGVPRIEYGYDAMWVAQQFGDGGLFRVDPDTLEKERVEATDPDSSGGSPFLSMSDVSVGAGGIWAFGSSGGRSGDMSWRSTATRSPEGGPVRVDPETHKAGDHIVMPGVPDSEFGWVEASDDLGVFVMAKIGAGHSKLFRVNPATEEVIGEPLDFGPGPFALESGFRSLWIADQHGDVVHRIEIGVREEADLTFRIEEKSSGSVRATDGIVRTVRSDYSILRRAIKRAARSNEKRAVRAAELAALQAELDEIIARVGRHKEKADSRSALNRIEKLLDKAMRGLD